MVDAKDDAPLAAKPEEPKPEAVTEKEPPKPPKARAAPPRRRRRRRKKSRPKAEKVEKPKEAEAETAKPKKAEAKPDKPKAKPKPKPAPQAEKKRDVNVDPDRRPAQQDSRRGGASRLGCSSGRRPRQKVKGQSNGTQMTMSVNEIDALRASIAQCWSPPPGGSAPTHHRGKLRLKLNEDGTLVGYPTVANSGSSPFFQAAADSAVRAVYQCQPYALPSEKYAVWRDMILNFDPSEMYRAG